MTKLSNRIQKIKPSPTIAVSTKAAELRSKGVDIIGLGAGEPDFDTPDHIKDAAILAIENGQTKYTAVGGTMALKEAIVAKFSRENNLTYKPEQIIASNGAKQSVYNLIQATINPGDEVIIPAPFWVSYKDICILAGATPVIIDCPIEQGFKLTVSQLKEAITPKTRMLMLNSPSNPAGSYYSKYELQQLAEVLLQYPDILIMTDDIYEHILWDGEFINILNACPELYDRTLVINGVAKAYAMTGWRIGYTAGPLDIIKAMAKLQGQSTSNPCSISQAAAIAALNGGLECVKKMLVKFKARHDFVVDRLSKIKGIKVIPSHGTFYTFPDVTGLMKNCNAKTDQELATKLLTDAKIAVVPGSAFGTPGHVRISFATSDENLTKALDRLEAFANG